MYNTIIVEDDSRIALLNKYYVSLASKELKVTALIPNGKAALDFLLRNPVDLVILDVYMPNFTGLELLKMIRMQNIPVDVIMVTAAKDTEEVSQAFQMGIVDYLVKPFDFPRFKQAIQKFLRKKEMLDSKEPLSQETIDSLERPSLTKAEPTLRKGLQFKTLEKIMDFITNIGEPSFTVKFLADEVGLSPVTTQRYLSYLVDEGLLCTTIDYNTGGRPKMIYKKTSS